MKASVIAKFISRQTETHLIGDSEKDVSGFASLERATTNDLAFCKYKVNKAIEMIKSSKAGVIICYSAFDPSKNLILVDNPRLWFIRVVRKFFAPSGSPTIHSTAVINDCVVIGKNVCIGAHCSIGFDGFGFGKDESGAYERFPHIGRVIIDDDVEIGSNVCIDRGALSDTIIGKGTKIDNLVHIAHNVRIGKNCHIVALTCIGGSVTVEDNVYIGIGPSIRNQIKIGEGATIGMGAVVVKDVKRGVTVIGNPAHVYENIWKDGGR